MKLFWYQGGLQLQPESAVESEALLVMMNTARYERPSEIHDPRTPNLATKGEADGDLIEYGPPKAALPPVESPNTPLAVQAGEPTHRADGWPLCPRCGEDELADLRNLGKADPTAELRCYRCQWVGTVLPSAPTETPEAMPPRYQPIACWECQQCHKRTTSATALSAHHDGTLSHQSTTREVCGPVVWTGRRPAPTGGQ